MSVQDLKDLILGWIPDNVMRLISPQRARNAYYSIIEFFWDVTGDKSDLETSDKSSLVNAINELKQTTGFVISEIILTNGQSFLFPEMNKGEAFVIRIYDEPNGTVWLGGYDGVAVGNDTLVICLSNSVGGLFSDVGNQFVIINQGADSQVIFVDELPDENLARTGVIYVLNSNNAMYVWDSQLGDYVLIGDVIPGTLISSTVFEDENNNVVVPEPNKLYFDAGTEIYYRWDGVQYVSINSNNFAHLNDQQYVKYSEATGRLESGKITETPAGIDVNGNIKTQAVELENETETPLPNQITRNGNKPQYTDSAGITRSLAFEPRTISATHNPPTVAQITSLGLLPGEFYKCSSTGQIALWNGEKLSDWSISAEDYNSLSSEQKTAVKIFNIYP